jgi:hypothetical protein
MHIYDNVTLNNLGIRKGSESKIIEKIEKKPFYLRFFENRYFMI